MNNSSKYPKEQREFQESSSLIEDRVPFNDAIEHGDLIQGAQSPKKMSQIPKWFQNPLRLFTSITLLIFAATLIYQLVQIITSFVNDK